MTEREFRAIRALTNELRALREQIEAVFKDQKPKDNTAEVKIVEPLRIEVTHAPELDPARTEYYKAENQEHKSFWRKAKSWVEAVGVLVAVAIAGLTLGTLHQVKRQADAVQEQLRFTTESFRIDERAWMEIDHIDKSEIGPTFRYAIYPKNVGKTVARDIRASAARGMVGSIILEHDAEGMKRSQGTILTNGLPPEARDNPIPKVLAPDTISAIPFYLDGQSPRTFSKDEWVSYLIGRFDYTDTFGIAHWKTFCFYVADSRGTLWNCHEGNEEDKNSENSQR